jgi:hypothetical protein
MQIKTFEPTPGLTVEEEKQGVRPEAQTPERNGENVEVK